MAIGDSLLGAGVIRVPFQELVDGPLRFDGERTQVIKPHLPNKPRGVPRVNDRLLSQTTMPPNSAFQLWSVAREPPVLVRQTGGLRAGLVLLQHQMICSSVNLARVISPSSSRPDSNSMSRKSSAAGHYPHNAHNRFERHLADLAGPTISTSASRPSKTSRPKSPSANAGQSNMKIQARSSS